MMNYAEVNWNTCPFCKTRRLPKGGPGVSAVACQNCGLVVEVVDPLTLRPEPEPETDRQVKVIQLVEGETVMLGLECVCKRAFIPMPETLQAGKQNLPACGHCGQVFQIYNGPRPVMIGFVPWKRPRFHPRPEGPDGQPVPGNASDEA